MDRCCTHHSERFVVVPISGRGFRAGARNGEGTGRHPPRLSDVRRVSCRLRRGQTEQAGSIAVRHRTEVRLAGRQTRSSSRRRCRSSRSSAEAGALSTDKTPPPGVDGNDPVSSVVRRAAHSAPTNRGRPACTCHRPAGRVRSARRSHRWCCAAMIVPDGVLEEQVDVVRPGDRSASIRSEAPNRSPGYWSRHRRAGARHRSGRSGPGPGRCRRSAGPSTGRDRAVPRCSCRCSRTRRRSVGAAARPAAGDRGGSVEQRAVARRSGS